MAGEEMINLTRLGDFHADMTVDAHILKRSTAYAVDDKVNKGLIYLKCTQAGTTASTALSLSGVSVGDTLTDGTAEWKVISIKGVPSGSGTDPIFYNDSPIGTIIAYMGITAPKDYLACDGTVYNIVDYKELAEYIKRQFGSYNYFGGDGTTTFAVPDLRGEFLRGTGTNSHTNQGSGDSVGVHQDGTIVPRISVDSNTAYLFTKSSLSNWQYTYDNIDSRSESESIKYGSVGSLSSNDTEPCGVTTRPTNTSVLYCIKYNTSVLSTPENNYSTEEQVIGTWIDGKPLYQKTVEVNTPSTANSDTVVLDMSLWGISSIVDISGFIKSLNSGIFLNYYYSSTDYLCSYLSSAKLYMRVGTTQLNNVFNITLQYTKTTD